LIFLRIKENQKDLIKCLKSLNKGIKQVGFQWEAGVGSQRSKVSRSLLIKDLGTLLLLHRLLFVHRLEVHGLPPVRVDLVDLGLSL